MKLKLPPALSGGQAGRGPGFGNSTLEYAANGRYIFPMADQLRFAGTVVRVEADGFGIIKFDQPIGRSGNTIGIFSVPLARRCRSTLFDLVFMWQVQQKPMNAMLQP
jgi:hypothetical protein